MIEWPECELLSHRLETVVYLYTRIAINERKKAMDLRQMTGQRLMIGIKGTTLSDGDRLHLKELCPGGVILFSRNTSSLLQVNGLISEIKELVQPPPLIAVDQEGGLVVRFFKDITVMPGNMALGATGSTELTFKQGVLMADELKAVGFDINLAPVVDVVTTYDNPGITIRSFGADPKNVAALAKNFVKGTQSKGIAAVVKHFPGKGAARQDAHFELPVVSLSLDELRRTHLYPFRECIRDGVLGVMSSHVIYRKVVGIPDVPATFSPSLIKTYLRDELNFQGIILSDDLEMGAISRYFPFEEAVVKAVDAGHDMILICSDYEKQRAAFHTLYHAYEMGALSILKLEQSIARLAGLRTFTETPHAESAQEERRGEGLNLAKEIAERAITLVPGKVPIPFPTGPNMKLLAIMPDLSSLESVEEGFGPSKEDYIGRTLAEQIKAALQKQFIPIDPRKEEIERVWENAKDADLVLGFIFNARYVAGQRLLLERLNSLAHKTILVLIRNPFDLEFLGEDFTTLVTYGYRKVQIAAAIKVLAGAIPARGTLPFAKIAK